MGVFSKFVDQCRTEHERLSGLLAQWADATDVSETGALPLVPAPDEPFRLAKDLARLRGVMPGIETPFVPTGRTGDQPYGAPSKTADGGDPEDKPLQADDSVPDHGGATEVSPSHPAEQARKRLNRNLARLGIEIVGIHGGLLEQISDLVIDSQLPHTLLIPDDRFHVTGVSVLGGIALANLAYMCRHGDSDSGLIELPLKAVMMHSDRFRNGDLLFWELAARSVCAGRNTEALGKPGRSVAERYMPAFLAHSTLAKLDLAFDLPLKVLRQADYRKWPGLAALVGDPGARSIRRRVIGRLAQGCAKAPKTGVVLVGRWMEALAKLNGDLDLPATVLAAQFLWELLEIREGALSEMASHGKASAPLLAAIGRIEAHRIEDLAQDHPNSTAHQTLREIGNCLNAFEIYRGLRELNRTLKPMTSPALGTTEETES